MGRSLVSVILIVRNGERYLAAAIDSVINSDYRPLEIIVVDGKSTDRTAEIAKSFEPVRYFYQVNQGSADAFNVGIEAAKGEFIAFISHDDLWTPNKLSIQVKHLISHPEIQYTIANFRYFLEPGCPVPHGFKKELFDNDHVGRILETLVARKSLFDSIGTFNTGFAVAADVDWFARAKDQNIAMALLPEVLLYKRVHDTNASSNAQANNRELLKILQQSISRQQSAASPIPKDGREISTMANKPLVSVIIPVYNCEKYLDEAIESALAQTHRPHEVIVVDDGSTDGSAHIAKRFCGPVRYDLCNHEGPGAARNRGVSLAEGSLFSFLDADDLWIRDKLAHQVAIFNGDPAADMVFGQVQQFHSPELDDAARARIGGSGGVMSGPHAGTLLIKRDSFFRAGPFATNWRVGEFIDWYARAMEQGLRIFTLPQVVMKRRLHGGNTMIRERQSQSDYARILKASLDRRRKTNIDGP